MERMTLEATIRAQQDASDPTRHVWVNANAGTGKTKVLSERVLRLLLGGVEPDAILCLTFTNNAAGEMRNRILKEARIWQGLEEAELQEALDKMLGRVASTQEATTARFLYRMLSDAPHRMHFTTIHGFCQELLQPFAIEAGLTPHFTVMDDVKSSALLRDAAQQLFRQARFNDKPQVSDALKVLAENLHDDGLHTLLGEMVRSHSRLAGVMASKQGIARMHHAIDDACTPLKTHAETQQAVLHYSDAQKQALRAVIPVFAASKNKTEPAAVPLIEAWLEQKEWNQTHYDAYRGVLLTKEGRVKKNFPTKKTTEAYPEHAQTLAQEAERLRDYEESNKRRKLAEVSHAYLTLSEEMNALYTQRKRVQNALDFDDLIHYSLALLRRSDLVPWVLYKMDRRIAHLLLDEAQDTSPQQWELIRLLVEEYISQAQEKTLFVVGDTKQSIYGFQGAAPAQLEQERAALNRYSSTHAQHGLEEIAMQRSFRCTKAILDVVDTLFVDTELARKLHYSDAAIRHGVHRDAVWGRVECLPLTQLEEKASIEPFSLPDQYMQQESSAQKLADNIAQKIKQWLEEKTLLPSRGRSIEPRDILILLRGRTGMASPLSNALRRAGVPVAGKDVLSLQSHLIVQDMLALSQWALLPSDDYSLACVLKSPLFAVTEETLFAWSHAREGSLWDTLKTHAPAALVEQLQHVIDWAEQRDPVHYVDTLLAQLKLEQCYYPIYRTEAAETLHAFADYIRDSYEPGERLSQVLHRFAQANITVKQQTDSATNEVRIMTIHGAKGLEAPIVFLPDTVAPKPFRQRVFFEREQELLLYNANAETMTEPLVTLRDKAKTAEEEEALRLLYVALTRAEDWLIIGGHTSHKQANEESWYARIRTLLSQMEGAQEAEDGTLFYETGQVQSAETPPAETTRETLPQHLKQAIEVEIVPPLKSPSTLYAQWEEETIDYSGEKVDAEFGTLLHRMIELLAPLPAISRSEEVARTLLQGKEVPIFEKAYQQVIALLEHPEMQEIFVPNARHEVPIRSAKFYGVIDLLIERDDALWIIDFKAGKPPETPHISEKYRAQLQGYQELMEQANPHKAVRAGLVWTQIARLDWLEL